MQVSAFEVILKVVIIMAATIAVASAFKKFMRTHRPHRDSLVRKFIANGVHAAIYFIGFLLCILAIPQLSKFARTLLAGSGIVALGITLAAQESLSNIICGMFITLFKPFEISDRVTLRTSNITGNIEDVTLRHTIIRTFTNTRIVIPNSTINKEIVENSNLIDQKASSFVDVDVDFDSDLDRAIEIMARVVGEHPLFCDTRTEEEIQRGEPKVRVYVRAFAPNGISLRASMWTRTVDENFRACSDVRYSIKKEFDAAGIVIPRVGTAILQKDE